MEFIQFLEYIQDRQWEVHGIEIFQNGSIQQQYGDTSMHRYRISGKWGQRCLVFPEKDLMITYLSHMENGSGELAGAVERYLLSYGNVNKCNGDITCTEISGEVNT